MQYKFRNSFNMKFIIRAYMRILIESKYLSDSQKPSLPVVNNKAILVLTFRHVNFVNIYLLYGFLI